MGYHNAGFEVTGVDIQMQHRYPFKFVHANATTLDFDFLMGFDVIHASPPCQAYSAMTKLANSKTKNCEFDLGPKHPELVHIVRDMLNRTGKPYIIENVVGAPLRNPVTMCGAMFDLGVIRHRLFETNWTLRQPVHPSHDAVNARPDFSCVVGMGGAWRSRNGSRDTEDWKTAMGIDWMDRYELTQAIPPAYTEYIGRELQKILNR